MIFKKAEDGNEILSLWMVICAAVKGQSNAGHPPLSAAWMEVYRVMQSVFKKAGISENNSILGFCWWLEGGLCAFQRLRL